MLHWENVYGHAAYFFPVFCGVEYLCEQTNTRLFHNRHRMIDKNILKQSFSFSALAVLYIAIVSFVMSNAERFVGEQDANVLAPIIFLLLLVISVATMGMLIFGKPLMLYMDGKKRDAVQMVICTIVSLMIFAGVFLCIAALVV